MMFRRPNLEEVNDENTTDSSEPDINLMKMIQSKHKINQMTLIKVKKRKVSNS